MWEFFKLRKWFWWAYLGTAIVFGSLWVKVKIDVKINEWFGDFYDLIQSALGSPNAITMGDYWAGLLSFGKLAALWIALSLVTAYFTSHWLFRWRTAMVDKYHRLYEKARGVEGASQRVQEDTIKFTRIVETLGTDLVESVMVLIQFFPILLGLSAGLSITFFGEWQYGLVAGAIIWTVGGTLFLVAVGWVLRLVGIEYDLQKQEAAYRKVLVHAEDRIGIGPKTIGELFEDVRKIHYKSYLQYLWFNVARLAYLQANVLSGYVLLAPAIVSGLITLGVMQQILRAFGRVEGSLQYLFKSWPTIIEFASVYKRLREFEKRIEA